MTGTIWQYGEKAIIDLQLQKQYSGWKKEFWDVHPQKLKNAAKNCSMKCACYSKQVFAKVCMLLKTY